MFDQYATLLSVVGGNGVETKASKVVGCGEGECSQPLAGVPERLPVVGVHRAPRDHS